MRLQIGIPKPMPLAFVVNRGLPSFVSVSFDMPSPESVNVITQFLLVCLLITVQGSPVWHGVKTILEYILGRLEAFLVNQI